MAAFESGIDMVHWGQELKWEVVQYLGEQLDLRQNRQLRLKIRGWLNDARHGTNLMPGGVLFTRQKAGTGVESVSGSTALQVLYEEGAYDPALVVEFLLGAARAANYSLTDGQAAAVERAIRPGGNRRDPFQDQRSEIREFTFDPSEHTADRRIVFNPEPRADDASVDSGDEHAQARYTAQGLAVFTPFMAFEEVDAFRALRPPALGCRTVQEFRALLRTNDVFFFTDGVSNYSLKLALANRGLVQASASLESSESSTSLDEGSEWSDESSEGEPVSKRPAPADPRDPKRQRTSSKEAASSSSDSDPAVVRRRKPKPKLDPVQTRSRRHKLPLMTGKAQIRSLAQYFTGLSVAERASLLR